MSLRLHCICALLIYLYIVYLCMYWHVFVFNTIHSLVVLNPVLCLLCISCIWVILPLHCHYIFVCINIFFNVISMFTEICVCDLYTILLGCTPYWEYLHSYLLYIIFYDTSTIIIDLHLKQFINTCLFGFAIYLSHALKRIYSVIIYQYLIYIYFHF